MAGIWGLGLVGDLVGLGGGFFGCWFGFFDLFGFGGFCLKKNSLMGQMQSNFLVYWDFFY